MSMNLSQYILICPSLPYDLQSLHNTGHKSLPYHGTFKSEFSYFSICSNYFDYDADLEEEADVNEEGNEDYFASL